MPSDGSAAQLQRAEQAETADAPAPQRQPGPEGRTAQLWVHRFAVATAVATYLLILIGGLVHDTGSSLACPDWPTCYGTLMPKMQKGIAGGFAAPPTETSIDVYKLMP